MNVQRAVALGVVVALAAVAVACGSGASMNMSMATPQPAVTPDKTITVQVKNVKFLPAEITVAAGAVVELRLQNMDGTEHDFQVDNMPADVISGGAAMAGHGGMMVAVHTQANGTGSVIFKATKAGTYAFNCTIAGHKDAGMVGTITVT